MIVIAKLQAQEGKEQALEGVLAHTVEPARADHGNTTYALHRVPAVPGKFVLIEGWETQADYDAHMASPHTAELIAALGDLLAGAPDIEACEAI
jgi:quinol monooxygenase YgiN